MLTPLASLQGEDSCFEIDLDVLYVKPCFSDLEYANIADKDGYDGAVVITHVLEHDWEPGIRGRVEADMGSCWGITADYAYLEANQSERRLTPDHREDINDESGTITTPFLATSHYDERADVIEVMHKYQYHLVNVLFGYEFWNTDCSSFSFLWGGSFMKLDRTLKVNTMDALNDQIGGYENAELSWDAEVSAGGLSLGGSACWDWDCLHLYAKGMGSLILGTSDSTANFIYDARSSSPEPVIFRDLDRDRCITGFQLQLGGDFQLCLCDFRPVLGFGIEASRWYDVPGPYLFTDSTRGNFLELQSTSAQHRTLSTNGRSFSLFGAFIRLGLAF